MEQTYLHKGIIEIKYQTEFVISQQTILNIQTLTLYTSRTNWSLAIVVLMEILNTPVVCYNLFIRTQSLSINELTMISLTIHYSQAIKTDVIHNNCMKALFYSGNSYFIFRSIYFLFSLFVQFSTTFPTLQRIVAMVPAIGDRKGIRKSLLTMKYPISSF